MHRSVVPEPRQRKGVCTSPHSRRTLGADAWPLWPCCCGVTSDCDISPYFSAVVRVHPFPAINCKCESFVMLSAVSLAVKLG